MLVICNGMFRSGSTLQYNVAKGLMQKGGDVRVLGFIDSREQLQENINGVGGDISFIVKAHNFFEEEGAVYLYSYRDLRDVALSLKNKLSCSDETVIKMLDESIEVYSQLSEKNNVLMQRYEDMHNDILESSKAVDCFLSLNCSQRQIEDVARNNSIDRIIADTQKNNKKVFNRVKIALNKIGFKRFQVYTEDSLLHFNHISENKGKVGGWKQDLPKSLVEEIVERWGWWLVQHGYEI